MTFASKARFSGIIVADLAKWLADQSDEDAKRDILELIEAAKRDPSQFRALRIKWAFYRLRKIAPGIIERESEGDLRDDLRHEWACLGSQMLTASPDWSAADRHLAAFHEQLKRAVHFEDVRPLIDAELSRREGAAKKRGSRSPKLDAWLDGQDLTLSNDVLWDALERLHEDDDLYRDADKLIEENARGKMHEMGRAGFDKRVTAARKRR